MVARSCPQENLRPPQPNGDAVRDCLLPTAMRSHERDREPPWRLGPSLERSQESGAMNWHTLFGRRSVVVRSSYSIQQSVPFAETFRSGECA